MNHVPRSNRHAEEIARIREVVSRHSFPPFVDGFDVELGEFAGDPAMWIVFRTIGEDPAEGDDLQRRVEERIALKATVRDDLLDEIDDRWPYFRFTPTGLLQIQAV